MAVLETTETRYIVMAVTSKDRTYNNYTSIPTSSILSAILFPVISYHSLQKNSMEKERCRDGFTCVVIVHSSH